MYLPLLPGRLTAHRSRDSDGGDSSPINGPVVSGSHAADAMKSSSILDDLNQSYYAKTEWEMTQLERNTPRCDADDADITANDMLCKWETHVCQCVLPIFRISGNPVRNP
jgi:hypothetical protein